MAVTRSARGRVPSRLGAKSEGALGRRHLLLWAVCTLGFVVDTGEIAIASALGAIFTSEGGRAASTQTLSFLLSSTYAGGAIGAIAFGRFAMRSSTRVALAIAMVVIGIGSLASALAPTIEWLIVARAISGLGIGAYPPLAIALLATHLPPRWRGPLTLLSSAIGTLGAPFAIYATRQLAPHQLWHMDGWQAVLVAGAALALLTSAGFARLRFVEARRCDWPPATDGSLGPAVGRADRLTELVILPGLYVMVHWAAVGFQLLSGIILLEKGYALNDALLFVTAMLLGPPLGTAVSGFVIDRVPRRDAILATLIVGAISIIVFGLFDGVWLLGIASVAFGMALGLYVPVMSLYAAEFFPHARRAEATSRLWALNRTGLIIAPLLLLPLLRAAGTLALTLALAAILFACAALMRSAPRGRAGRELT